MISAVSVPAHPAATFASARQGMQRALDQVASAGTALARGDIDPGEVVKLVMGPRLFAANARVVRTADEMLGTLLDTMA